MSSSAKQQTVKPKTTPGAPDQAPTKGNPLPYIRKEKKVTINPMSALDVDVVGGNIPGLKDPMMIIFAVPGQKCTQYTVHRKIGHDPGIPDDGWVLSQSTDIPGFLENQKDIRIPEVANKIATLRTETLLRYGGVEQKADKLVYPGTDIARAQARKTASAAFEVYKKDNPEGLSKLIDFFAPDQIRVLEVKAEEILQEPTMLEKIQKLRSSLDDFVTYGGPAASVRQKEVVSLRGITSRVRIISHVIRYLWKDEAVKRESNSISEEYFAKFTPTKPLIELQEELVKETAALDIKKKRLVGTSPNDEAYDEISSEITMIEKEIEAIARSIKDWDDLTE